MSSKKITVDPLPVFPDIIISMHYLGGEPPRFHWILFVQSPDSISGTKLHATELNDVWEYERTKYTLQFSGGVAAGAVIGKLTTKTLDQLDSLLKAIPMKIPDIDVGREAKWSCRVWLREALRRMHSAGFINCPDVDKMEAEMWELRKATAKTINDKIFTVAKIATAKNSK